jgi:hypothetical protein
MLKNGGSDGTRTRGLLRDRAAFRRQREVKSDVLVNKFLKHGLFLRRSRRETHLPRVKFVQRTRARP